MKHNKDRLETDIKKRKKTVFLTTRFGFPRLSPIHSASANAIRFHSSETRRPVKDLKNTNTHTYAIVYAQVNCDGNPILHSQANLVLSDLTSPTHQVRKPISF